MASGDAKNITKCTARHSGNGRFLKVSTRKKGENMTSIRNKSLKSPYKELPGRRIIDIRHFSNKFDEGCYNCGSAFQFKDIIKERKYGLCSVFVFKCKVCSSETKVASSRRHKMPDTTKRPYAVNVKSAIGMIHTGIGATHVNGFLNTLGIPGIHHKTMKKVERLAGPVIERTAKDSCTTASKLEKEIFQKQCSTTDAVDEQEEQITFEEAMDILEAADEEESSEDMSTPAIICEKGNMSTAKNRITECIPASADSLVNVTVSQDAAWSKRGRGMNSLSGWGHVVGIRSKKCLNFSTRIKNCATCSFYERTGREKRQHDCRKNWCKSAKAMEPDIAVQLHRESKSNGIRYSAVVGDEDSSSIQHVRTYVNPDLVKYSDIHHIKRGIRSKLEILKKSHKALTPPVRDSSLKFFPMQ